MAVGNVVIFAEYFFYVLVQTTNFVACLMNTYILFVYHRGCVLQCPFYTPLLPEAMYLRTGQASNVSEQNA